jgi:hypothetical protein
MPSLFDLARCAPIALLFVLGCGSSDEPACTPGASVACVGTGGCAGGQVCNAAGSGFGACECALPADAGSVDAGADDMSVADAGAGDMSVADGGPPFVCLADVTYGDVVPVNAQADAITGIDDVHLYAELSTAPDPAQLSLRLSGGYGVFTGGSIAPGVYTITGDEADPRTCGVCLSIAVPGEPTSLYAASGGTVTITSVSSNFAGTLSDITFAHWELDGVGNMTPSVHICESAITSMSFDVPINVTP